MLRRTLPFLLVFAPLIARAQTPTTIQAGQTIQIPVPSDAGKVRLQLLSAGTNLVLDDARARLDNGVAVARLDADPGTYDVRVVSNDKARTPLGPVARFQIPGFKREAGRWLFNGSPVVVEGANPATVTSFVPNLRRDGKVKLPVVMATGGVLKWDVQQLMNNILPPPPNRLRLGIETTGDIFGSKRTDAAYIASPTTARDVEQFAPQADALVINNLTILKIARRNVEEAPNFDLPVFAQFQTAPSPTESLAAFQAGASNIIVPDGATNPVLDVLTRQAVRFTGAVTLEDVGLRAKDFDRFAPILRRAGRVPLLGRLPGEGNGEKKSDEKSAESLFVAFDGATDAATLDLIERAAKVGATIYCEGALPPALFNRWSDITKVQIAALPAPKRATLTLAEPWFWGTLNDANFDVSQTLTVSVKPSLAAQTKDVKGQARETVARPIARFNDDPNGILLCPIGKGRVIWAPFDVYVQPMLKVLPIISRQRQRISDGLLIDTDLSPLALDKTAYYAAVAGAMQPALVEYAATKGDASGVSVALRALPADPTNPKTSAVTLVAFFNQSRAPVDLEANVRGDATYALDLMTDQPVPVKVRDFGSRLSLSVPANGFRWLALAKDASAWNDAGKGKVRARLR